LVTGKELPKRQSTTTTTGRNSDSVPGKREGMFCRGMRTYQVVERKSDLARRNEETWGVYLSGRTQKRGDAASYKWLIKKMTDLDKGGM